MKASTYFRRHGVKPRPRRTARPRDPRSVPTERGKAAIAKNQPVCAACPQVETNPPCCKLLREWMGKRRQTMSGCGGCGRSANDPVRYYGLVLRGAPHPARGECRLG